MRIINKIIRGIPLFIILFLLPLGMSAQKKDGHWVDPVEYFKLKGSGRLDGAALYNKMWETKERHIVGMKVTVCDFDVEAARDDVPADQRSPYTAETAYLYIDQGGAIGTTCDTGYGVVWRIGGTDIRYSFDERSHAYSFDYTPTGTMSGIEEGKPPYEPVGNTDMGLFYTDKKGMLGYLMVSFMTPDQVINREDIDAEPEYTYAETEYYLRFKGDEVLLDGTDTPLTETERQSLIDKMDELTDWLMGKDDKLGLGEHTGPTESAVIEIIGLLGSILLANGVSAATGGGVGGVLGAVTAPPAGGAPSPTPPNRPQIEATNPKKEEEEETPPEPEPEPEPQTPYFDKMTKQNPDGTLSATDPITGKPLTYYPTADGKWESELGTVYDKKGLNENLRYRAENAGVLKQDAEQAAKNVAEQHAQWEKDSKELSHYAKDYKEWKEKEQADWEKQQKIHKLADKYGVAPTEKAVKDAIKWEQQSAQMDANIAKSDAEAWGESLEYVEKVDKTAELVVNVMGEAVPGGRVVKNAYTLAKSTLVATAEAATHDMSMGDAVKHIGLGAASGAVGVLQNQAGDLTSNIFVEGIAVVGGEGVRAGLDAIAKGEDVNDAILSASAKKLAYFGTGKVMQFGATQYLGDPGNALDSASSGPIGKAAEKFFGKGNMHADWGNLASSNGINLVEGTASLTQEMGATYDGYGAMDPVNHNPATGETNPYLPDQYKTVEEYAKAVKQFSNAAEKFRKNQST